MTMMLGLSQIDFVSPAILGDENESSLSKPVDFFRVFYFVKLITAQ